MRPIDVKELERQVKEAFKENPSIMGLLLRWIRKQPTLTLDDIVPHGRWRGKPPLRECQCCGEIHSELGGNDGKAWDYCPSCGAKMDLEEE